MKSSPAGHFIKKTTILPSCSPLPTTKQLLNTLFPLNLRISLLGKLSGAHLKEEKGEAQSSGVTGSKPSSSLDMDRNETQIQIF